MIGMKVTLKGNVSRAIIKLMQALFPGLKNIHLQQLIQSEDQNFYSFEQTLLNKSLSLHSVSLPNIKNYSFYLTLFTMEVSSIFELTLYLTPDIAKLLNLKSMEQLKSLKIAYEPDHQTKYRRVEEDKEEKVILNHSQRLAVLNKLS